MAWFINHYVCADCGHKWKDEWSAMCDDDCPRCGARHMSAERTTDLTEVVQAFGESFQVLVSPDSAEHSPDYEVLGEFETQEKAEAFLKSYGVDHC